MKTNIRLLVLFILCIFSVIGRSANVTLEHSNTLSFDKSNGKDYQILRGDVRFRHENAVMYCDSAYFYDTNNSFDAFGNVRVIQDTMRLNCQTMYYDGNARLLKARGSVDLQNGAMRLTTDWLDYYRDADYGYYASGGTLVDPEYTITSNVGYYYTKSKHSFFKGEVHLVGKDYTIDTDSLKFNQQSNLAYVFGPSVILYSDYEIKTTYAWTNTQTQAGRLYNRSVMTSKSGRYMTADSIYFSQDENYVELFGDAIALDDSTKSGFSGDYGYMYRDPDRGLAVGRACLMDFSNTRDTMFIHGDTIRFLSDSDSNRVVLAYPHCKVFSKDMRAKCDSLTYLQSDSLVRLDGNPVVWADESQMTGDTIIIYMKDNEPNWVHIWPNSFVIQQQAADAYDQISGKECKAFLKDGNIERMDMIGNAISMYYAQDDYNKLIGVNRCMGPLLSIFLKDNKMDRIMLSPESKGIMYPPGQLPESEKTLRGFKWRISECPQTKEDIFVWE